jgi:hypothetical protein
MLNRNVTRYLASFVACFALCTHSFADCIRVSPNGTEFTNTCSYKLGFARQGGRQATSKRRLSTLAESFGTSR